MINSTLIIDRSSTQSPWMRGRDWLLSAAVWLLYLYLVRAALFDLYDIMIRTFYWVFDGKIRPSVPKVAGVFVTLWYYVLVALTNAVILIVWARYNQFRFRGPDRRRARTTVSSADLAALYQVSDHEVAMWQGWRLLSMQHDDGGTLISVTPTDTDQTTPITAT